MDKIDPALQLALRHAGPRNASVAGHEAGYDLTVLVQQPLTAAILNPLGYRVGQTWIELKAATRSRRLLRSHQRVPVGGRVQIQHGPRPGFRDGRAQR